MEMVRCPNCEAMANGDALFCPNCGSRLPEQKSVIDDVQPIEASMPAQPPVYTQQPTAYTQPPVYTQQPPVYTPAYHSAYVQQGQLQHETRGNGPATAGMVLGIISMALLISVFSAMTSYATLVFAGVMAGFALCTALPGLGLSIGGVCRRNRPKGKAIAGLVLNAIVLLAWIGAISALESIGVF